MIWWRSLVFFLFFPGMLLAQSSVPDSIRTAVLDQVVVTATRNERLLGALPMPVTLISKAQIKAMGSLRLTDVLNEQTGLVSVPQVNGIGNGLQLQGFDPEYTLILIDGEPLVGRTTGSLDLSRITVGNIKQIEIVKGPSSSLYGSEALAGVVNIITDKPQELRANVYTRYGSNNTLDVSSDFSTFKNKLGLYVFGNRYSTSGYDLSPSTYGKTVSPYDNYTLNSKVTYKFTHNTQLRLSGRYYDEHQTSQYQVDTVLSSGTGRVTDWSLNPVLTHRFSTRVKSTFRFYTTQYKTHSSLRNQSDGSLLSQDDFLQTFTRPEATVEYFLNDQNFLTLGAGFIQESVRTDRYGDENKRMQGTRYGFLQHEWTPLKKLTVITGARYDHNTVYGSQLSPKFSANYVVNNVISLKGSIGVGFKAPDFRQLYLNFTNAAGGGYSVFGTEIVKAKLAELQQQGQIQTYLFDPSLIGKLKAERSSSFNLGGRVTLSPRSFMDVNFFRNNISGLIETQAVAIVASTYQAIYSYRNLNRVYTDGVEYNFIQAVTGNLSVSVGYQLLFARDKDKLAAIKRGEVFRRDPVTLESYRLKPSEYFGLYNRSRHMGNVKIFYQDPVTGWSASLRVIYRGRYGIGSTFGTVQGSSTFNSGNNGNDVLDVYDKFVPGYALVNVSVAKTWFGSLRLQTGMDNLFNHTQPDAIPNLAGRLFYTSLSYTFSKKNSN
jgi:outer membrane receptor for ferrienterochelin and colicins